MPGWREAAIQVTERTGRAATAGPSRAEIRHEGKTGTRETHAGRRRVPRRYPGRGLVIVHALCDLVLVHPTAAGTTVRLHMRREAE